MTSQRPAPRRPTPAQPDSLLTPEEIALLFTRLAEVNPAPRTELHYADPFTLLVAVVLSAQATDLGVNKATARLVRGSAHARGHGSPGRGPDPRARQDDRPVPQQGQERAGIEPGPARAARGPGTPARADLEALPGVGRKTANVVLNEAFGEPTIAVDTHVFRVANRTGLAPGKSPDAVEAVLDRVVPAAFKPGAHHWLILHGRYVCIARRPACPTCVVRDICRFPDKTPAAAPAAARPRRTAPKPPQSGS